MEGIDLDLAGLTALGAWGSQSALDPAGEAAAVSLRFTVIMTVLGAVIFVVVMGLVWAAFRARATPRPWWILGGGVAFPVVVLFALTVWQGLGLRALAAVGGPDAPLVIEVTGKQYWWDVTYDPEGLALRDANEIVIPAGRPVELRLKSADVIHSFWLPSIAPKLDMIPGRTNTLRIRADEPGRYRGQCAEFCGTQHPRMAFEAVVMEPPLFDAWLRSFARGRYDDPDTPQMAEGEKVFLGKGCPACHAVRGLAEGGRLGPDLTRLGARGAIGAGMWRNNVGNLAGWVADVQDMKPGAHMPSYGGLSGPELRAVAHWLRSLR